MESTSILIRSPDQHKYDMFTPLKLNRANVGKRELQRIKSYIEDLLHIFDYKTYQYNDLEYMDLYMFIHTTINPLSQMFNDTLEIEHIEQYLDEIIDSMCNDNNLSYEETYYSLAEKFVNKVRHYLKLIDEAISDRVKAEYRNHRGE